MKKKKSLVPQVLHQPPLACIENCFEKTFRDVGVGSKEFNEFENIEAKWKFPNGDKLILGVIDQVCRYEE